MRGTERGYGGTAAAEAAAECPVPEDAADVECELDLETFQADLEIPWQAVRSKLPAFQMQQTILETINQNQ
eukprot:38917-Rhodomonas_salina.2